MFFGLLLNQKAEKNEMLIKASGPGPKSVQKEMAGNMQSKLCLRVRGSSYCFRIVAAYEHMGSMIEMTGGMLHEATKRTTSMNDHFVPCRRKLYGKQAIAMDRTHYKLMR